MTISLPTIISEYFAAADRGDVDAVVACFANDAIVFDEDQEWHGHAGIRQWRTKVATAYEYTVEVRRRGRPGRGRRRRTPRRVHPPRGQLPRRHRRSHQPVRAARRTHHAASRSCPPKAPSRERVACRPADWDESGPGSIRCYDDDTRTELVVQAEALGYPTAWLGFGRASIGDLALVERVLDATATITVATAIVNMWTNDPTDIADAYRRIAARHRDRFLLGIGIGHPESITTYHQPYATMVDYLDQLDAGGVPADRRILAALGPRALRLAADRTLGTHPYLVVPDHTRAARQLLGPDVVIAPEHKVVLETDPESPAPSAAHSSPIPISKLQNYTNNLRRYGYTDDDIADGGSDRLIDALVLHGSTTTIAAGLRAHLDAGADHVAIQVLTANGADPMPGYEQLARVLL